MKQTAKRRSEQMLAVNIEHLAGMLDCGTAAARKIGEQAQARIVIGRRVLYSVEKIQRYLNRISE